jgi:hypothetical protein
MARLSKRIRDYADGYPERQAARDRLPNWAKFAQFLIWVPLFVGIFLCWFDAFNHLLHFFRPAIPFGKADGLAESLIAFPGLFAAGLVSLIATNLVLWLIPPLRRANENAAEGVPDMSFRNATGSLLKGAYLFFASLYLALLGCRLAPLVAMHSTMKKAC